MLPGLLAQRLGIEELVDQTVDLGDRPGAANPGRQVMTLLSAMVLGVEAEGQGQAEAQEEGHTQEEVTCPLCSSRN